MAIEDTRILNPGDTPRKVFGRLRVKRLVKSRFVRGPHDPDEFDVRSVLAVEFFINKEQADLPDAKPVHVDFVTFDIPPEMLKFFYEVAKADPRFAGARDV